MPGLRVEDSLSVNTYLKESNVKLSGIGIAKSTPEGRRRIIVRAGTVKSPIEGRSRDGGGREKVKDRNRSEVRYEGANADLLWISACSSTGCL